MESLFSLNALNVALHDGETLINELGIKVQKYVLLRI